MTDNNGVEKIYIAAPFRAFATAEEDRFYGVMNDSGYQAFLEKVDDKLKGWGYITCLPHRDEGEWGQVYILPEDIAEICFKHIESSSLVIVFPGKSRGVHIEIGYAAALRKKIIVFLRQGEMESTLLQGLGRVTEYRCLRYGSDGEFFDLLEKHFAK
jgi:nucleoside 2-deoxyribosyltransferase